MQVSVARNGRKAIEMVQGAGYDLIVLDLMLPDLDGLEICRRLKGQDRTKEIPVVMLTARGEESDIVAGLEMGADDYVTKPFSPRVLMARLRNALRKTGATEPTERVSLVNGRLLIDRERHVVTVDGQTIELTVTEFGILHFLALRPGFVRTRDQIISAVHGRNTVLSSRTVDVHVTAVRRKLGALGECVQTVRGVGYRFRDPNDLTE
jgi:two-component system phosphate regulon response regulator PhoB